MTKRAINFSVFDTQGNPLKAYCKIEFTKPVIKCRTKSREDKKTSFGTLQLEEGQKCSYYISKRGYWRHCGTINITEKDNNIKVILHKCSDSYPSEDAHLCIITRPPGASISINKETIDKKITPCTITARATTSLSEQPFIKSFGRKIALTLRKKNHADKTRSKLIRPNKQYKILATLRYGYCDIADQVYFEEIDIGNDEDPDIILPSLTNRERINEAYASI